MSRFNRGRPALIVALLFLGLPVAAQAVNVGTASANNGNIDGVPTCDTPTTGHINGHTDSFGP